MIGGGFVLLSVSKKYSGTSALDQVSLQIPAGSHAAILGPSGCGKSTLLRLLAGLDWPTSGTILLDGQTISTAQQIVRPPHRRGISMVFQDLALWPNLTVRENIRMGLAGQRLRHEEGRQRLRDALDVCGIAGLADRFPSQLSGGQQQRLALARAIAVHPRFLLLDEPFSGVDLATKVRLLAEIAGLARDCHFQVVLVSHDPWEALELCETAIILDHGKVRADGQVTDLCTAGSSEPFASFQELQHRIALRGGYLSQAASAPERDKPEGG